MQIRFLILNVDTSDSLILFFPIKSYKLRYNMNNNKQQLTQQLHFLPFTWGDNSNKRKSSIWLIDLFQLSGRYSSNNNKSFCRHHSNSVHLRFLILWTTISFVAYQFQLKFMNCICRFDFIFQIQIIWGHSYSRLS